MDFTNELSAAERSDWKLQLDSFVVQHAVHHRPVAVVTSGGTVADLELNSVRCLDNFSTGLRGSIAVEELLKRGYAVIHVWRRGSAAPFARVLTMQCLGLGHANESLTVESLGRLFAIPGENQEEDLVQTVLQAEQQQQRDPWLSAVGEEDGDDPDNNTRKSRRGLEEPPEPNSSSSDAMGVLSLHRSLAYSTALQRALRERSRALSEGRLLTVPFRSVEEYLAKLQLCALAVHDCQSLAMFVLAAAVSDFYIPKEERTEHKIQSSGGQEELVLCLRPVPKVMKILRTQWAPHAFMVSFKLETDMRILREKADKAVERSGSHLVVGNLLQSRHEKVWILAPDDQREQNPTSSKDWSFTELTRSGSHVGSLDTLEAAIVDFCVQSHFEYISWHFHSNQGDANGAGATTAIQAAEKAHRLLLEKKRRVQRELFWKRANMVGLEIASGVLAVMISYSIHAALRRRLQG